MWEWLIDNEYKPLGYRYLVEHFALNVPPHYRWTYLGTKWEAEKIDGTTYHPTVYILTPSTKPLLDPLSNLIFALKHEGINLLIIKETLLRIPEKELLSHIESNKKSKYARLIWFYYEHFLQKKLPTEDLTNGNYIPALNPKEYYTCRPKRSPRYLIHNNFLGDFSFCPIVRRTEKLEKYISKDYSGELLKLIGRFKPETIARASQYIFTKETLASWEIEREQQSSNRIAKFTNLLRRLPEKHVLKKETLIQLQKEIVDKRFALNDYRDFQNYVGEESLVGKMILHYIPPRPEDLPVLMEGLLKSYYEMMHSELHPVIIAATLSFGFVLLHPFSDGNGRLHRYLIHYVLHLRKFTPNNLLFPISASILRDEATYDQILEQTSQPLLEIIQNFTLSALGKMHVTQKTKDFYSFIDFTKYAEYLFHCIEQTITTDFEKELAFLQQYDTIKKAFQNYLPMPDRLLDLLFKYLKQNEGKLSLRKREKYFSMLTDKEIAHLEGIYQKLTALGDNLLP
ncbi:MAG: Fic family protein [Chlamydiales bacterium]